MAAMEPRLTATPSGWRRRSQSWPTRRATPTRPPNRAAPPLTPSTTRESTPPELTGLRAETRRPSRSWWPPTVLSSRGWRLPEPSLSTREEFSPVVPARPSLTTPWPWWVTALRAVWTTGWSRTPGAPAGGRRATSGSREESRCAASAAPSSPSAVPRAPAPGQERSQDVRHRRHHRHRQLCQGLQLRHHQRPGDDDHHGCPRHQLGGLQGHLHQLSRPGQVPLLGRVHRCCVQEELWSVHRHDPRLLLHLL